MRKRIRHAMAIAFCFLAVGCAVEAQEQTDQSRDPHPPSTPQSSTSASPGEQKKPPEDAKPAPPHAAGVHRFWDRENDWLFAGVGAGRALDYASTLNLRHRGINEAFLTNSVVDNHPLFATIEVAATGASIGVSYLFHRTGHHRLERWTSAIHLGIAVGGAIRNYNLKSPQSH